jgi:hypothetical protein
VRLEAIDSEIAALKQRSTAEAWTSLESGVVTVVIRKQ